MRHSLCGGIVVLALLVLPAVTAVGQETATPVFRAPYRAFDQHEFGASLSDPGEGVDLALEGFYRYGKGPYDFGVRGGFADTGGDTRLLLGGDFRTQIISYSESFPLDGALTLGLGGLFGEGDDFFLLPVGISLGRRFDVENSSTTFVPYVHPNIVPVFGRSGGDDVEFTLGLGVDVRFGQQWAIRASGGLGDIEGVGISLALLR